MPSKKPHEVPQSEVASERLIDNPPQPARRTKQALLLELIGREGGAVLEELTSATGWLPHTVRSAITALRKRGYDVRRQRVDGASGYVVASDGE